MKIKYLLTGLVLLGIFSSSMAQENKSEMKTLFGNTDHKIQHGGYGAVTVGYSQLDGNDAVLLGGRAGWVIDHHVTLGFAGKALVNSIYLDGYWPDNSGYYLVGGYGGFFVEPVIAPNFPIHVAIPIMIGGGGLALNDNTWHDYDWQYNDYNPYDWDTYFVCEPGLDIELNLVKFVRASFGVSYRYTTDLHMQYVPKDLMRGFNYTFTLKMGLF